MKPGKISDFISDPKNANKGNERGRRLLRQSIRKLKAGRSLLADKHGVLIAGNKTRDAAIAEGLTEVIIVPTDGTKLVVVQRTDLDLETDPEAKELAIADNRINEVGLEWESDVLAELNEEVDLSGLWTEDEWAALHPSEEDEPGGAGDDDAPSESKYAVAVECRDELHQKEIYNLLAAQGLKCKVLTL